MGELVAIVSVQAWLVFPDQDGLSDPPPVPLVFSSEDTDVFGLDLMPGPLCVRSDCCWCVRGGLVLFQAGSQRALGLTQVELVTPWAVHLVNNPAFLEVRSLVLDSHQLTPEGVERFVGHCPTLLSENVFQFLREPLDIGHQRHGLVAALVACLLLSRAFGTWDLQSPFGVAVVS